MKIKTAELIGIQLDWAVSHCKEVQLWEFMRYYKDAEGDGDEEFQYSTDWKFCGPIVESEIHTLILRNKVWNAECYHPKPPHRNYFCYSLNGPTPLIASLRAYVASRLGPEVTIPDKLVNRQIEGETK